MHDLNAARFSAAAVSNGSRVSPKSANRSLTSNGSEWISVSGFIFLSLQLPKTLPQMREKNEKFYWGFQRAAAAFLAIPFFLHGERFLALDRPPFRPPILPKATAWGLQVSRAGRASGSPSICSPMACSTMPRATSMKSRFGLERLGVAQSCHGSQRRASPVEIMETHYPAAPFLAPPLSDSVC